MVHYQAMAGKGDEVAALLATHTAATRAEPGNLDFVALRSSEDPDAFVLYERYTSQAAFKAHTASPHFEGIAVAQIRPLLADRTVEFCQVVEPVGDVHEVTELITPGPAQALAGLLGVPRAGEELPLLWHWVYLLDRPPQDTLGPDGHPARGGMPDPPGPGLRRMFAGGRVWRHGALRTGPRPPGGPGRPARRASRAGPGRWFSSPYAPRSARAARS